MRVTFNDEDLIEPMTAVIEKMAEEANIELKQRAHLKRWRARIARLGSSELSTLVDNVNASLREPTDSPRQGDSDNPDHRE